MVVVGLFVLMPLRLVLFGIYAGFRARRIISQRRYSPAGEKVLRRTRRRRGRAAVVRGYLHYAILPIGLLLMNWGYVAATDLMRMFDAIKNDYSVCTMSNHS